MTATNKNRRPKSRLLACMGLSVTLTIASSVLAFATEIKRPDQGNAQHSVWIYQTVCVQPMPDTAAVEKMAETYGFTPITGQALQGFAPSAKPDYLKAWTVTDHERSFRVATSIANVDAQLAEQFPAYAKGKATGCTVILPGKDDPKGVAQVMKQLWERDPDASYEAGPFQVSTWVNQSETNAFLIYHYAPKSGKPGGLLSLVTLSK